MPREIFKRETLKKVKKYNNASLACTMSLIMASVGASNAYAQDSDTEDAYEEIVVSGIRSSLKSAMGTKRDARGVVDAISAEDIGKFPDTNLAESLQRITGVSIDRSNGEGSKVTVRGFGPDFNLVTLNGRQMPTSSLEATTASSSRSFDFGNLASESISGVQVYKSGKASITTGGIGSTINISTTRPLSAPGLKATIGAKAVYDQSQLDSTNLTPEISGLFSNTFADDKFGVAVTGSYQKREGGFAQASSAEWRGAYAGDENNWGTLPQDGTNVTNRPDPSDVYAVPQNFGYNLTSFERERTNGQVTLQYRPIDTLTATLDYTYSENKVAQSFNDISVWFNFGDTSSEWTDGPVAGPVFYTERFGDTPSDPPSDLAMGAGQSASKNTNKSLGLNVEWDATDNLSIELDIHDSSAESKADSPYGNNSVIGTAAFNLVEQGINYSTDLPILHIVQNSDDIPNRTSAGSAFRNGLMRDDIRQGRLMGDYNFDDGIIESLEFGVSYTENKVRSAFATAQRDTWGGAGPASDIPDDIYEFVSLPDKFSAFEASSDPNFLEGFYSFDFDRMVGLIDTLYNACGGDGICRSDDFTTDRRTTEEQLAAYVQANAHFELGGRPANLTVGVRYEETDVASQALVPVATGTQWVAANEFGIIYSGGQDFTELDGKYDHILPNLDFDIEVMQDVMFRASYSETITRPGYADIQGGQSVEQLFRVDGGNGSQGDPKLLPFESKNIDLSVEYYFDEASYFSVGYFSKDVKNFIGTQILQEPRYGLVTPIGGQRYNEAVAALGADAGNVAIRDWIFANADPSTVEITGVDDNGNTTGNIFGVLGEDPELLFDISVPINERDAKLDGWEFALQHTFGDSGFGGIINYTMVNGDVEFDNTLPAIDDEDPDADPQFALVGLSDTANVIGFYDKDGIQVRVAYNWRDKFLNTAATAGGANNPSYTEAYHQIDMNASYDINDNFTVFVEAINITNETTRTHGRHVNNLHYVTQGGARYNIGARYTF